MFSNDFDYIQMVTSRFMEGCQEILKVVSVNIEIYFIIAGFLNLSFENIHFHPVSDEEVMHSLENLE